MNVNMMILIVSRLTVQGPIVEVIGNNNNPNNPPIKSKEPNIIFFIDLLQDYD